MYRYIVKTLIVSLFFYSLLSVPANAQVTGFVTRIGSRLNLQGTEFRFAGANVSWLAMRTDGGITTHAEIDDVLETAKEMGVRVIRSHTLGISVGCGNCAYPSKQSIINNQPNQAAFSAIDYAIQRAGELGIYLIIPFTDQAGGGGYYSGGNRNFAGWDGDFYTSSTTRQTFKQYISNFITHRNQYTNVLNRDNPTILAWETGNEMRTAPAAWTLDVTAHIKQTDSNHLVLDGNDFFKDSPYSGDSTYLNNPNVDIFQTHHYPLNTSNMVSHGNLAAAHGKAFIEGENGIIDGTSVGALTTMYGIIENMNNKVSGSLFWQLFGHADHHGYLSGNASFSLHYPGETADKKQKTQDFRNHAYRLRGQSAPASSLTKPPLLRNSNGQLSWRGVPGGDTYTVERSTNGGPWSVVASGLTDSTGTWNDGNRQSGSTYTYRLRGYNRDGAPGAYSTDSALPTATPPPPLSPGDLNRDGRVDIADCFVARTVYEFARVVTHFGR